MERNLNPDQAFNFLDTRLQINGPRTVFALHPDGRCGRKVTAFYTDDRLTFTMSPDDHTLHCEIVAE